AQGTSWKRRQKYCKNQRTKKSAVILCLLKRQGSFTYDTSATCVPKQDLNTKNTNRYDGREQIITFLLEWKEAGNCCRELLKTFQESICDTIFIPYSSLSRLS
ncbi:hypothetical protein STEG23_026641, partial [Scotinomys teguina]